MSLVLLLLVVLSLAYANGANDARLVRLVVRHWHGHWASEQKHDRKDTHRLGHDTALGGYAGRCQLLGHVMAVSSVNLPDSIGVTPCDLADVTVVIPAFNEEASLPLVLGDLPEVGRVIVVNNGSTDGTTAAAFACGATVVHEPRRGYGSACLRGLAAIEELVQVGEPPPQIVVFLDADSSRRCRT